MEKVENISQEILTLAKKVMLQRGLTHPQLAKKLDLTVGSVHKMFQGKQLSLERVAELSLIFNYNFFVVLAERLEFEEPKSKEQKRIYELEIENRTLIKILKDGH